MTDYSPTGNAIFTEIEATYKASLLKKKAFSINNLEALAELHESAINTLEVLYMNLITTDISMEHICKYYKAVSRENVIKLLLRCKMLYEARTEVKKILSLILKKESHLQWITSLKGGSYSKTLFTEQQC